MLYDKVGQHEVTCELITDQELALAKIHHLVNRLTSMKILNLTLMLIAIFIFSLVAGCSSPSREKIIPSDTPRLTITIPPTTAEPKVTARHSGVKLEDFVITRDEVPFTVVTEGSEMKQVDPESPEFMGVIRFYNVYYANEPEDSPTYSNESTMLIQYIGEMVPENASQTFESIKKQTLDDPSGPIIWLADPNVGEKSFAYAYTSDKTQITIIMFKKANIVEGILMRTANPDIELITKIANMAAEKIPSDGTIPPIV